MRAIAAIAVNVFRESVRDKVLYNLVLFAMLLIGASYLIGQLTAGQDVKIIKDLGLAATVDLRPVHRGLHRHRPGLEGSRAAQHLQRCSPSRFTATSSCSASTAGLTLTLAVNVAVMAAALYAVLGYMAWGVPAHVQSGWDAPALDPALLKAIALIFVELMLVTAIALFFSTLLDADAVRRASPSASSSPATSAPTCATSIRSSTRRRRRGSRAASTGCCRTWRSSTSRIDVVHGIAGAVRLHGAHVRLRGAVHRDAAVAQHAAFSRGAISNEDYHGATKLELTNDRCRALRDPVVHISVRRVFVMRALFSGLGGARRVALLAVAARLQAVRERDYPPSLDDEDTRRRRVGRRDSAG